ncbi:Actin cytoskeleton-regulatory complex protein sla1 [Paraphaeosphaeria minitans]|uniref:Actin cytoskeleton-regulatory complex protein SLA1 n=1 Tax=Paraphaeosphaeria minitans TaxID=565426 RepID=A0A9P6GIE8_9PLEO|nr:Actin cytoskeleton-regulatory complex protein sla1 [Paraphaeosphaeria minitans]
MVFLGIYRAIYDYVPQSGNEIALTEGNLLMVLEKSSDDDWWKAKKKGSDDDDDEPEGLIPNNYIEEATPIYNAKALYDYARQTDEELSFKEDADLDVYDVSDPDWTLVGLDGDYGFAPANYIEIKEVPAAAEPLTSPSLPPRSRAVPAPPDSDDGHGPPTPESPAHPNPAQALAGIIQKRSHQSAPPPEDYAPPPKAQRRVQFTPEESDEEAPPPRLPQRPPSGQMSPPAHTQYAQYTAQRSPETDSYRSPPSRSVTFDPYDPPNEHDQPNTPLSGSGYHLYNIYEYLTQPGKNKKMPITLGINIAKGMIMIAPEKSRDGPQQEWTADKLEYYSQEGKHVFLTLKQPSKDVDFHCGAKDTASEICSALGELSGAAKGAGLREILAAGSRNSNVQRKGVMLFDFMAQGEDEVTVGLGDEILVLDDSASDEWWKVRRLKNGKEGVVPANYVELTDSVPISPPAAAIARSGTNAGRSIVDQNRREEEELTRQVAKGRKRDSEARNDQVGPGLQLPARHSSLLRTKVDHPRTSQRSKRDSTAKDPKTASKPNTTRLRTWTDRSGSFKVEAEFLTIKDGKIHLHKVNGVKIAVPVPKMSVEDLEYVERAAGISLDDDKPLSDIKRRSTQRAKESPAPRSSGISVEQKPSYDWFDFFLQCGVNPQICERYAQAFTRDQMGEENMPDITEKLLRNLGVKEGDILRVMKFLDKKYNRSGDGEKRSVSFAENGEEGGLFSGPGGTLRNNTRKGRPAPPVQTNDIVDAKAFEQKTDDTVKKPAPAEATPTPLASAPVPDKKPDGFEDNAWDIKPSRQPPASTTSAPTPPPATAAARAPAPALTGSMSELSLLDMPAMQPEVPAAPPVQAPPASTASAQPAQPAQPQGFNQSLFDQVAAVKAVPPPQLAPRVRPQAPQVQGQGGLIAPPPQRASSAPQNPQQAYPPPLQPQLTGFNPNMHTQVSPPGQSLQDLNMQRMQQQATGFQPQSQFGQFQQQQNGMNGMNGMMAQPTGFQQAQPTGYMPMQAQATGFQPPMQQNFQTGFQPGFQQNFAGQQMPLQAQPTGFNSFSPSSLNPQATGINQFLPPALQAEPTGFGQNAPPLPPMPPMPSMPTAAPLVPQRTGPPPPVRFGTQPAKKLVPQPTGRANLAKASMYTHRDDKHAANVVCSSR